MFSALFGVSLFVLGACDGGGTEPRYRISSVQVDAPDRWVRAGAKLRLTATVRNEAGEPVDEPVWWSTNNGRATVADDGVLTAVAAGEVTVTAHTRRRAGSITLVVADGATAVVSGWSAIAAGTSHTCGITMHGEAYCWGNNTHGTLGDGTRAFSARPVPVAGGLKFTHISAGQATTCGTLVNTATYCWGAFSTATAVPTPVSIYSHVPLAGVVDGNGGYCGLSPEGRGYCGVGNLLTSVAAPAGDNRLRAIATTSTADCGLRPDGELVCWRGRVPGDYLTEPYTVARTPLVTIEGSITNGNFGFVCGLDAVGTVHCTDGWRSIGGNDGFITGMVALRGAPPLRQVSAGGERVCGVDAAGAVFCWSRRAAGGAPDHSFVFDGPVRAGEGLAISALSVGDAHMCGVTASGGGYCWGSNGSGVLGIGTEGGRSEVPVRIATP